MNTKIGYMYRDASNYKEYGEIIVEGIILSEQIQPFLYEGEFFIPEQVGLIELQDRLRSFPSEDDHVWHSLELVEPTEEEADHEDSAEVLLEKFSKIGKWDIVGASKRLGII